ncbi:MAG: hypothetical protein PHV07_02320 [Oscillospiraceae bacterium]|nr:hypothetical protein [Oscillospiraceae bacterium]
MFDKKRCGKLSVEQLHMISKICTVDNIEESIKLFIEYMPFLSTVSIIKTNQNEAGIDIYELFKEIPNIKNHLYTPFYNGKVNFINTNTIVRYILTGNALSVNQSCVSFDTQTVSYLKRYLDGKQKELPENISSVLRIMQLNNIGVDYIPYTVENLLYESKEIDVVLETVFSFEKLYYNNKKSDKYCLKSAKKILSFYNSNKTRIFYEFNDLYQKVYVTLLTIISIKLMYQKQSLELKMKRLYDFMQNELRIFLIPEINIAYKYFKLGQNFTFFGKVQKNKKDILKCIKNMSWDLFHLRFLEMECKYINSKKVDMFIPFMFTYDKRLLEIKKFYELNALAVSVETNERFSFYTINLMSDQDKHQFFTSNAINERRNGLKSVNIEAIILKYEKLVASLI